MSAIYGIVGESDPSELTAMGDRMGHRGMLKREWSPAPSVRCGQRLTDFESTADGSIVFDGMLDNAPELVACLDLDRASDQEIPHGRIAWELYHRYGRDGFGRLSGQFAIALWDEANKQLVMARDRWGARPLYYTRNRKRILFASEYKAFLAVPEVLATCNREAILYALRTRHGDPNACFLAGIEVVPRGSWSVVQSERIESKRLWDITIDIVPRSEHEHAAAVRASLLNALRRQMAPFQRVGLALSGGLDSALVLAGMRNVSPEQVVHTFTVGYGPEDGEIIRAAEAARYFETVHHEVIMGAEELPALLPEAVWHMEEPVGGEEMIYQFVAAREAAKHVQLLFSGEKADAQFGGMPRHKLIKLAFLLRPFRGALEEFFHYTQTRRLPESRLGRLIVHGYFRSGRPPALSVLGTREELPPPRPLPLGTTQPLSEKLRRDILGGSSKLSATFRLHAAHNLRWNSPFLDPDVLSTAFQIPDHLKIRGLRQKYILRRACEGLVPESILRRKKSLQRLRHDAGLSDVLEQLAAELLSPSAVATRGLFVPAQVEQVRRRPAGKIYPKEQAYSLWALLVTEIWARLYLDQRGRSPRIEGFNATRAA